MSEAWKYTVDAILMIYLWGPLMLLAMGGYMYAADFWRMEDSNSSTTHRRQMLRKIHM